MIETEYVQNRPTSIDDIKDETFKADSKRILILIDDIEAKKIREFEESVRKTGCDKNYKLTNLLLSRHFLIKTVQEVNKELIKKKKRFRVNFTYDACILFHYRTEFYWKEHGYYNDNGTISIFHVNQDGYVLDLNN